MALMREVDDMVDEQQVPQEAILQRLIDFDEFAERYPSLAPTSDNLLAHQRLHSTAADILHAGDQLATARSIDDYISYRTSEARATAQLFEDSATEEVRSQPETSQRFIPLLQTLGEAACFLDSAKDLPKDYQANRTQLAPTLAHRTQLLRACVERVPDMLSILHHRPIHRQLGNAAIIHIARRL